MQLFEKWQRVTEAYTDFYEEAEHLGLEVVTFLKHFCKINDTLNNAVLKMFNTACDGFSILVKTAESIDDFPLVFKFTNDSNGEVWEFIVRDKQDENKTMRDFIKVYERDSKTHSLEKQINKARECLLLVKQYRDNKRDCAVWIIDYLIVELLVNGGFDDQGAINKLLETKKGFVAGAFYKEGLGDIDLVWGNKDYGLEHILKRRIEKLY